jgi:hypothetical protein
MHRFIQIERAAMAALAFFTILAGAGAQTSSKVLVATGAEVETVRVPGTVACIGGTPLADPKGLPCSPGTTRFLMSYTTNTLKFQNLSGPAAALFEGATVNQVSHCNTDGTYYGHCWGHSVMTVPGTGGQWEGPFSGMFDVITNTSSWTSTLYGYGGKLEGLQAQVEGASTAPGQPYVVILKVSGL